ncbi:DedA family protein [Helicobacter sp.]|uniref:DedA family protein n=1 Tax=Helicobacter sp. TaxID=218 RepID=UPI0025B944C0|nr:DedA family protein [Helicobacter sp.]MBR2495006.1 DedA family protein [Helicobacter sp.]
MNDIIHFIVDAVGTLGYAGIFFMMFLESSFFPFPSEVVMIPAGYLVYKDSMDMSLALAAGAAGSLAGAIFNYVLALYFGRAFVVRFGKYVFFSEQTMTKMEGYFSRHGEISTFLGRLIPGVRQYISLPAGLAKMNLWKFSIYTTLGALIWITILAIFGYYVGTMFGDDLSASGIANVLIDKATTFDIRKSLHIIVLCTLGAVALIALLYILWYRRKRKNV